LNCDAGRRDPARLMGPAAEIAQGSIGLGETQGLWRGVQQFPENELAGGRIGKVREAGL